MLVLRPAFFGWFLLFRELVVKVAIVIVIVCFVVWSTLRGTAVPGMIHTDSAGMIQI